jgi:hypothetical protein
MDYREFKMRKEIIFLFLYTISSVSFAQVPKYQDYNGIIDQLKTWEKKYDNTKVYKYGHTRKDLAVLEIKGQAKDKKKVLVFGCIHSNEPLSNFYGYGIYWIYAIS